MHNTFIEIVGHVLQILWINYFFYFKHEIDVTIKKDDVSEYNQILNIAYWLKIFMISAINGMMPTLQARHEQEYQAFLQK